MKSPQWVTGARERLGQVMRLAAEARARAERTIFWRVWERMAADAQDEAGVTCLHRYLRMAILGPELVVPSLPDQRSRAARSACGGARPGGAGSSAKASAA